MLIIIKDKEKIIKKNIDGIYKYKGIKIDTINLLIKLDNNYYFSDGTISKQLEVKHYRIINKYNQIDLYVYDKNYGLSKFKLFKIQEFVAGASTSATITLNDPYLKNKYLVYRYGRLESNTEILLNNRTYKDEDLKDGDKIELLSFTFYYFKDFLYINDLFVDIKLSNKELDKKIINYKINKPLINNYYEEKRNELIIDNLDRFQVQRVTNDKKLILQMGPTLTTSMSMLCVASINVYNAYLNNTSTLSLIALMIMPITMLISGILWPIISNNSEKKINNDEYFKNRDEYLDYLKEYENNLIKNINNYLNSLKEYFFNELDINSKLFYVSKTSNEFLKLTLGSYTLSKDIQTIKYKDEKINEYVNRIKYRINKIDNCPLFLDLKENKRVTIITDDKYYLLNRYLLELATKYSFNDLNIAIFSKDKSIFNNIVSIPHLFINNKRLTLIDEREVLDLNNLNISNPLVILCMDLIDYKFTNENIYLIYFSYDLNSILKESNSIVEYKDNEGLLNRKIHFKYENEQIDFNYYYRILETLNNKEYINQINSFNDIYEGLDIEKNYLAIQNNLVAKFGVMNNEVLNFDLHESKDGPHGLIGGSTGSGKSELIVSLLLSLIIRYRPDYLNIILIDYKGGGIKESLSYNKITVPHIIASINNLEEDTFERLMVAINRECKKRELLFKKLSSETNSSISNLDDYLKINEKYNFEKLAHILIVVDEFAELKKENPEIIKELISLSRIGRSLGIHLILATQKPSGVIDDEIWSNSHFKISLKVHNEKDSLDLIKSKEAAYLTNPGEFILQVDNNYLKAKAIYSKKDINNNDALEVSLLDHKLEHINTVKQKFTNTINENVYIVDKVINTSLKLKIKNNILAFEKPINKTIDELIKKYNINNKLILGEIDDYLNAYNTCLNVDINENIFIYSNRKNEINNLLNQLNEMHKQTIIVSNNRYLGAYISDSINYDEEDDILYLFNKLMNDNVNEIHLIIEDLNTLLSYKEEYFDLLYKLIRRSEINKIIIYLLSNNSNVNYKLLNLFKNKYVIDMYESQDLINIFGLKGNYKGKSYFYKEVPITFIPSIIEEYKFDAPILNNYVDKVPEKIIKEKLRNKILIGYNLRKREKIYLLDKDNLLITGMDGEILNKYKYLLNQNNIDVMKYSNDIVVDNYHLVIWVGEGIEYQRLFFIDKNEELKNGEGYLFKNNKPTLIRMVSDE